MHGRDITQAVMDDDEVAHETVVDLHDESEREKRA